MRRWLFPFLLLLSAFVLLWLLACGGGAPHATAPEATRSEGGGLEAIRPLSSETLGCSALDHSGATVSRVEHDDVWVWFRYWPAPLTGRAVVHFYPFGRHTEPRFDIDLGQVEAGAELTGEYGRFHVPGITEPRTTAYNIDLEISGLAGDIVLQCDRGGALELKPRPPDPPVVSSPPPSPPTTTVPPTTPSPPTTTVPPDPCGPGAPLVQTIRGNWDLVPFGADRYQANVTTFVEFAPGPGFVGELQVFWQNGTSSFVKARSPLNFACHAAPRTEVLSWQSEIVSGSHPHVNCTVHYFGRLVSPSGQVLASEELTGRGVCR